MHRRLFIQASALSLLAPAALRPCMGATVVPEQTRHIFFDERFPAARARALSGSGGAILTGVSGDVVPVWNALESRIAQVPLSLRGVTTRSFHFCLDVLARDHAVVETQVWRLDRDLEVWTISTVPKTNNSGRMPWRNRYHPV
jgi:hypothetical protein